MIRSISENQEEILTAIRDLHCGGKFDCDSTYGNGSFYKNIEKPRFCFDLEPLHPNVEAANSESLPLLNESIESIVVDLPFLTYIRSGREGNGSMVMSRRVDGYWSYQELIDTLMAKQSSARFATAKQLQDYLTAEFGVQAGEAAPSPLNP